MRNKTDRFFQQLKNSRGDALISALVILLVVAASGFGFIMYKKQMRKHTVRFQGDVQASAVSKVQQNLGVSVQLTEACKTEKKKEMRFQHFEVGEINRKVQTMALLKPDVCSDLGSTDVIIMSLVKQGQTFYFAAEGRVKVTSLREVSPEEIPDDLLLKELPRAKGNIAEAKKSLNAFSGMSKSPYKKWTIATFLLEAPIRLVSKMATPVFVSFLNIVELRELDPLLKAGARFIDVRPQDRFTANHYGPGINVPYLVKKKNQFKKYKKFKEEDTFRIDALPGPFTNHLVFIGESQFDLAPVRAATMAYNAGWTQVSWFRGGEAERRHLISVTQKVYPFTHSLSADDLKARIKTGGLVIVDVRDRKRFEKGHIDKAINIPYNLRARDKNGLDTMSARSLQALGDSFPFNQVPVAPSVVLYGEDETDFTPVKAAAWLTDNGRGNTFWLREGFFDWNHHPDAIDSRTEEKSNSAGDVD